MSHQPFEDWILSDDDLSDSQRESLAAHVAECSGCARLSTSRSAVERILAQAEVAAPAPGFGARFAWRLEARRRRSARRQGWMAFGLAAAGAGVVAAPLGLRLSGTWSSPASMFVMLWIRLYDAWVGLQVAGGFLRVAWRSLPEFVPPAWGLGFVAACLGLGVVWMATLYRFAFRRVMEGA